MTDDHRRVGSDTGPTTQDDQLELITEDLGEPSTVITHLDARETITRDFGAHDRVRFMLIGMLFGIAVAAVLLYLSGRRVGAK